MSYTMFAVISLPRPYAIYTGFYNCGSVRKDEQLSIQAHSVEEKKDSFQENL